MARQFLSQIYPLFGIQFPDHKIDDDDDGDDDDALGVPVASQLSVTARPSVARVSLLELSSMMFGGTEMVNIFFELSSMMFGGNEIGNSCIMMPDAHVMW